MKISERQIYQLLMIVRDTCGYNFKDWTIGGLSRAQREELVAAITVHQTSDELFDLSLGVKSDEEERKFRNITVK